MGLTSGTRACQTIEKLRNFTKQTNDAVTLTYKYDQNSRMIGETREEGKAVTRTNYAYDKAGQLTSFRRSDGNAEQYKYDPAGNMVEKVQNGVKIAMTYTAANELQSMESPHGKLTYAYDANGNLTQKTYNNRTDTYSYDARNHLRQYKGYDNYTVKYSYNALGMLHAKEATGSNTRTTLEELIAGKEDSDDPDGDGDKPRTTTYVYDLTRPYYEVLTESTDGKVTSYTYGLERLAAYTEQVQTKYLYDGRGSVIQTNGESKFYSPFGELLSEKTSGYGFNGEYYDAATGMLNLRARQYEPAQGRFSQKDSEKGHVANARSLNAYLYCYNDGVNYFDASGAKPEAVRNNTTVDAGDGGSYAVRSAKEQAEQARKDAARRATKPTSRERIAQDNPEEMARSEYVRKHESASLVEDRSEKTFRYICRTFETDYITDDSDIHVRKPKEEYGVVKYDVPLYFQGDLLLCWAFSQVMIESYQEGVVLTNEEATARAIQIAKKYHGSDEKEIWNHGGWPTNMWPFKQLKIPYGRVITGLFSKEKLYLMLEEQGPLYAYYTNNNEAHLVVVTGIDISSDTVYTNNPWKVRGEQTYEEFLQGFATEGQDVGNYELTMLLVTSPFK